MCIDINNDASVFHCVTHQTWNIGVQTQLAHNEIEHNIVKRGRMGDSTNPIFLLVDNLDSPSLVEQSQQGCGSSCYTLLAVIPGSMKCLMPYACQLASCSMGISYYAPCSCSYDLMFPVFSSVTPTSYFLLPTPSLLLLPLPWGSAAPFLSRVFSHWTLG